MNVSARKVHLSKRIAFNAASGELLHAFHRSHIFLELTTEKEGDEHWSHYTCFDKFMQDLALYLDKNCKGLWAKESNNPEGLVDGKWADKNYNGVYKVAPNGSLLRLNLYFEEPEDLALFIKEKALLLKLSAE